ncbi:uncharacterized protein [Aristolochia californica]|uniref:uncharacterized protein n=1 Tax=Aristolochia californica TaxID=171875 RepID=UPI0035E1D7BF
MVKLLVGRNELDVNATNLNGLTAMDFLPYEPSGTDRAIRKILRKAGGKRKAFGTKQHALLSRQSKREKHEDWLMKTKGMLMIVAVLIATVTYQAGLYPPGGTLQMDANSTSLAHTDEAPSLVAYQRWRPRGLAVMAVTDPDQYHYFTVYNTMGFLSSLSIILMLVSGFPLEQKLFMRVLMVITWIAIISMAFTYSLSISDTGAMEKANRLSFEKYDVRRNYLLNILESKD